MIGIFDSGVGGLSVLRHIQAELPYEMLIYVADQAHVPYGPRPAHEIQAFGEGITRFLLARGCHLILVACNTATAAAVNHLRQVFPNVPFVGTEPAVKPAALQTQSGKVGVLATSRTFESQRYTELMARFAQEIELFANPCIGLVPLIEAGAIDTPETEQLLRRVLEPMLAARVDTVVLGCTHYPFVLPVIERIVGTAVTIIDPAPAVARQTRRLYMNGTQMKTDKHRLGEIRFFTTGKASHMQQLVKLLLGWEVKVETAVLEPNFL